MIFLTWKPCRNSTRKDITFNYKCSWDIPRLENVDQMGKLNPRITLGLSSDLGIAIPRFNPSS